MHLSDYKKYKNIKNKYLNLLNNIEDRTAPLGGGKEQIYCYWTGCRNGATYGAYFPSKHNCVEGERQDCGTDKNGKVIKGWEGKLKKI